MYDEEVIRLVLLFVHVCQTSSRFVIHHVNVCWNTGSLQNSNAADEFTFKTETSIVQILLQSLSRRPSNAAAPRPPCQPAEGNMLSEGEGKLIF